MKINSLTPKRLIIEGTVNNKKAYFLVDTGASIGLIAEDKKKSYSLSQGKRFNGTLIGGSGNMIQTSYICDTLINIGGKVINQFILSNISGVRESIKRETGYEILGIIGLPQMKMVGCIINLRDYSIEF